MKHKKYRGKHKLVAKKPKKPYNISRVLSQQNSCDFIIKYIICLQQLMFLGKTSGWVLARRNLGLN
jgi:hypothetical protein